MKIKRLRRQETPRIVGDDSARSEPTEVADSNNFKPLLKEKRLKEQTLERITKKERVLKEICGKRIKATQKKQQRQGNKTNLTFCFGEEYHEEYQGLCEGKKLAFRSKKGRQHNVDHLEGDREQLGLVGRIP
ncbi:hypothetical protein Tco_0621660 [Tanacetum coccineum]